MCANEHGSCDPMRVGCCPGCHPDSSGNCGISRRSFLGGVGGTALGSFALTGLTWPVVSAAEQSMAPAPGRQALIVKPVLVYSVYTRRHQSSWRPWGGVEKPADADKELARIAGEVAKLRTSVDFPVTILPPSGVRTKDEVDKIPDLKSADVVVIYAAGGGGDIFDAFAATGKHVIFFIRHRSGPVYLWYEIISPRYMRDHTDAQTKKGMGYQDIVVDSQDDLAWRLRALCGLKNTMGTRIIAIGSAGGWGPSGRNAPALSRERWNFDIQAVPYPELGKLIEAAREDRGAVDLARKRAADYLKQDGVKLETEKPFVENAFLLEQVFRGIMAKAGARAITINGCMGTIMPIAQTTACLTLSLLNDAGFLAFCESDFVVIPSGVLMAGISGRPVFLNDPTYPHHNVITLAHCTAPRRMEGATIEPVRLLTHFESDYGAAPKVEMRKGQKVTNILPDFAEQRWVGLAGEIIDAPFLPICRSQIDVQFKADPQLVAERMPGFHWMTCYGDYTREIGYALGKTPIAWEALS